jgi:hypothetical protein
LRILSRFVILLNAVLLCFALTAGAEQVTVVADNVNVRAVADLQGEILGQVGRGDALVVTGKREDGWIEVLAPASVAVWVYAELVVDGVIAASQVRLRSGPGVGFRPVGSLNKGDLVKKVSTKGDWLQIVPPPSARVWVNEKFVTAGTSLPVASTLTAKKPHVSQPVDVAPKPDPVAVKKPAVIDSRSEGVIRTPPLPANPPVRQHSSSRPVVPVQPEVSRTGLSDTTDKPAASVRMKGSKGVESLHLVAHASQARQVVISGVLRPAGFFPLVRPSSYRLTASSGIGPSRTVCYVIGDESVIRAKLGIRVKIEGKQYWAQGVREPVVAIDVMHEAGDE